MKNIATANLAKLVLATSIAALLTACGGGGGDTPANNTPAAPSTPQVQNPTDPYTGKDAGAPTVSVSGSVYNNATAGATVTAYLVNPDGSNGASLGTATTDANGNWAMTLSQTTLGMVRFVATGGTFKSEADASTQTNGTLELVAPYVTATLSQFVITPVTNVASGYLTQLAGKQGKTLKDAYTTASSSAMSVVTGNNRIGGVANGHAGVDYLSIVPGSAQDTLSAYADGLLAIEYYAIDHDLPSRVANRILAQTFETGFPSQKRADGSAVNVGKWVLGVFDETTAFTVADMGVGNPNTDVQAITQAKNAADACASGDKAGYYQRYPLPTGQSDYLDSTACTAYTNKIANIKAKTSSNKRNNPPA